jgi:hypothetical protein
MNHDEKGPMENLLEGLDLHSEFLTLEELKAELRARGIAIDDFLTKIKAEITAAQKADRLRWMKLADEKKASLRVAENLASKWIDRTKEEILAAFAALSSSANTAVAFRNKEKLSLEDMAEILDARERVARRSSTEGGVEE